MSVDTLPTTHLYQEIQQFYAGQMQLLDSGAAEAWADTFTEDGVFAANANAPVGGRSAIAAAARSTTDDLVARRIQRRHWLGMLHVQPVGVDEVKVSSYALILEIPSGGEVSARLSTTCDDTLVRGGNGGWLVRERRVVRDDLR